MSFCSFSREAASFDMTPIENEFLMEYMPAAPDFRPRRPVFLKCVEKSVIL